MWILVRWSIGCFHKLYLLGGSFVKFQIPSYILNLFFRVFFFFFEQVLFLHVYCDCYEEWNAEDNLI